MNKELWIIDFVNQKAIDEFNELPKDIKARMLNLLDLLEIYGNGVGKPHTASLEGGFFEIRAKSSEGVARSVYCYQKGKKILILVTAVKKQDKLPDSIIQIAKNRLKEYENGNN